MYLKDFLCISEIFYAHITLFKSCNFHKLIFISNNNKGLTKVIIITHFLAQTPNCDRSGVLDYTDNRPFDTHVLITIFGGGTYVNGMGTFKFLIGIVNKDFKYTPKL